MCRYVNVCYGCLFVYVHSWKHGIKYNIQHHLSSPIYVASQLASKQRKEVTQGNQSPEAPLHLLSIWQGIPCTSEFEDHLGLSANFMLSEPSWKLMTFGAKIGLGVPNRSGAVISFLFRSRVGTRSFWAGCQWCGLWACWLGAWWDRCTWCT